MAIIKTDNSHYTNIANTIRSRIGTETQFKPSEMPQGVESVYNAGYEKGKAEVIPAKVEQEKTVTITENGVTEILPDDNKVLSKVMVNVDVKGEPVFYTAEGRMYKEDIEIPETVASLPAEVYKNATNVRSVTLPSHITSIGRMAFDGCVNLKDINLPESVTVIDYYAFSRVKNLHSTWRIKATITILNSMPNGFNGGSLIYEEGITNLPSAVAFNFSGCTFANKAYVYLPSTVVDAGGYYSTNGNFCILTSTDGTCTLEVGEGFNVQIYCAQFIQTAEKWVKVGEALFDRTGLEPYTLIMGATNIAKLTDEQKLIFTNKNWTLA